jgi:hypothetical protein
MKKHILYLLMVLMLGLLFAACEGTTDPDPAGDTGGVVISSTPDSAQIWINNVNRNRVTPDTIRGLAVGNVNISIRKNGYVTKDTTVTIIRDRNVAVHVTLVRDMDTAVFGPIRLWETVGTGTNQPSGLDLSTGIAGSVVAGNPASANNDIYYSSSGYVVRSANNANGRSTSFFVGNSANLFDGVPSPLATNQWTDRIQDTQANYVFLFDQDLHYSKLKVVNRGGGTGPNDPAWVDLQWIYNKRPNDRNF